jgi:hypothetical protein
MGRASRAYGGEERYINVRGVGMRRKATGLSEMAAKLS